jgi:hypothetical protein
MKLKSTGNSQARWTSGELSQQEFQQKIRDATASGLPEIECRTLFEIQTRPRRVAPKKRI